jgi:hypothetical protein
MPFLQAFVGLLIPVSLAPTVLAEAPVLATLMSFVPLMPVLACCTRHLDDLAHAARTASGLRHPAGR